MRFHWELLFFMNNIYWGDLKYYKGQVGLEGVVTGEDG